MTRNCYSAHNSTAR